MFKKTALFLHDGFPNEVGSYLTRRMRIAASIALNDGSWVTQSVPYVGRELLWHPKICMLVVTFRLVLPSHCHGRERQMWEILAAWFCRGRPVKSRRLESLLSDLESSFKRARVDLWWDLDVATFIIYSKQNHFAGLSVIIFILLQLLKRGKVGKSCLALRFSLPTVSSSPRGQFARSALLRSGSIVAQRQKCISLRLQPLSVQQCPMWGIFIDISWTSFSPPQTTPHPQPPTSLQVRTNAG